MLPKNNKEGITMKFLFGLLVTLTSQAFAQTFSEEVDLAQPISIDEANKKVEALVKSSKIFKKEYFCVKSEITCRAHYTLTDLNGNKLNAFYVRFVSVDRSIGGNGYFFPIKGQPRQFVRFEDFSYDGKFNMNSIETKNIVTIEKTKEGSLKAILGVLTPKLGTTKVTKANIIVGSKSTVLEGTTTDSADPSFSETTRIEYLRTKITN